ncbi:MAG: HEAT repeat domain-containing protein [Pelovirga sp.]
MDPVSSPYSNSTTAVETLLKQLNVTRRMLGLYPPDHPQIRTHINRALTVLNRLWDESRLLTLGITPTRIYVNNCPIAQQDPIYSEFARFFFHIGVVSISFHKGLDAQELIRFHQLLHNKDEAIFQEESFAACLEAEKIFNISVQLIDYAAFHEKTGPGSAQAMDDSLWEDFLQRLQEGSIETVDYLEPDHQDKTAELFSRKLSGTATEQQQAAAGIGQLLAFGHSSQQTPVSLRNYDKKLNMLLERLPPETRSDFLHKGLRHLESHEHANLQPALTRISPGFLEAMVGHSSRLNSALSPRLLNLINSLSTAGNPAITAAKSFSAEETRTRIDILFQEEQEDLYMPSGYQQALHTAISSSLPGTLSADDRGALNELINNQSVEEHTARIIYERLQAHPEAQLAATYQNHLLDFSRRFLEAGNYVALRCAYQHWSRFISQSESPIELLAEKLVAYHTQASFMAEVLDGFDLWEADRHQEIIDYIVLVGSPYCEPIVERLGLARNYPERRRWIDLLTRISGNAQQTIIPFLGDERWYLVRNLVMVLGAEPTPTVLKAIQPLYHHPHPQVRTEAIRLLFSCNPATANRLLLDELNCNDDEAVLAAVGIAHLSSDPEVLTYLHRQLEKEPNSDDELNLSRAVVKALCQRGEKESLVIMRRFINRGGLLVQRRTRQLQRDIIAALADFRHPAADKLLEEIKTGKFRRDVTAVMAKRREPQ